MATDTNSTTNRDAYQVIVIWLANDEVIELRAEMERRNAERVKRSGRLPLDLAKTAELMLSEVLKSLAEDAAQNGGAQ